MNFAPHRKEDGSCSCCGASAIAVTSTTTGCCQQAREWVYGLMFDDYLALENNLREAVQLMDVAEHIQDDRWLKRRNILAARVGLAAKRLD